MKLYTNTEDLANRIIEELSKLNEPIVFKGAMALHYSLRHHNPSAVSRRTKDIDGDYTNVNVTTLEMLNVITKVIKNLDQELNVRVTRDFSQDISAKFVIYNKDEKILSIDLSVRRNPFYKIYLSFNDVPVQGATETKMVADKIVAISTQQVFRRAKDLIDLYILSYKDIRFKTVDIVEINREYNRQFGDFAHFKNSTDKIEYAYEKLRGVENKPDFSLLYNRLQKFVKPFMNSPVPDLIWNGNGWIYRPE